VKSPATQQPSYLATQLLTCLATICLSIAVAACSRATSTGSPAIRLTDTAVEVTGLSTDTLNALTSAHYSDDQWQQVFRVAVSKDAPPMLGSYAVSDGIVRFTPAFPLDAGRQYDVAFDAARIPGAPSGSSPVTATVGRPAEHTEPSTVITQIYPTADSVPANVLRMYIEFSAPMGRKSGVEYIKLLDEQGKEVPGAVLPLDYEFWSPDHTRFTVFFDPGRVKQGILPNRQMGRAFKPGEMVTLVVSHEWRDEHGLPLKDDYRRTFHVTAPDERPLDPSQWRIAAPAASSREPVVVTFSKTLDHSLLMRAVGIRRDGNAVAGDVQVGEGEASWRFTPRDAWRAGTYQLFALQDLEDIAGNQVGRAFEVDNFDTVDKDPDPKAVTLPFVVR